MVGPSSPLQFFQTKSLLLQPMSSHGKIGDEVMSDLMYQCVLVRTPFADGSHIAKEGDITIGWIEERGAKLGVLVELIGEDGLWCVTQVYNPGMKFQEIQEQRRKTKKSFLSISKNRAV